MAPDLAGVVGLGEDSDEREVDEDSESGGIASDGDSDSDGDGRSEDDVVVAGPASSAVDDDDDRALQTMLAENMATDMRKGRAVVAQQNIGKSLLEHRILLQQVLTGVNSELWPSSRDGGVDDLDGQSDLMSSTSNTLAMFIDLHEAMISNNSSISQPSEDRSEDAVAGNVDIETQWVHLDRAWNCVQPFVSASVDRWHHKTMLATGAAAMRSRLKSLGQSPSAHIDASLAKATQQSQAEDNEKYDDGDFYRVLLTEFLDEEMNGAALGKGSDKSGKRKRVVDTRASKGRKLRYSVHDKLVNFMAPIDPPASAFSLASFGSLFGTAT